MILLYPINMTNELSTNLHMQEKLLIQLYIKNIFSYASHFFDL